MPLGISILGSGSQGNSIVVHNEESTIMIDAGFSRKELLSRLEILSISPASIKAMLITHEHEDHVRGCRVFSDQFNIPVYLTEDTFRYLSESKKVGARRQRFAPGTSFPIGNFNIDPFSVNHDALDPVGFIISVGAKKIGLATDLGHINHLARHRLQGCDALIIECNHDIKLLRNAQRPLHIIRRIMGRQGHLNNEDAISAFDTLVSEDTKYIFLAHISAECNDYELVENMAQDKLKKMKRTDILLKIARQEKPLETVWID